MLTLSKLIFFVLHDKVSLLTRRCPERGTRIISKEKIDLYKIVYEIEIRLPFYRFCSTFWNIWGGFALKSFING